MTALRTPWQKIQHYFWLVCGVCCLFAALVFWAITDKDEVIEVEIKSSTITYLMVDATSDAFNTLYKKRKIRKAVVGNMF